MMHLFSFKVEELSKVVSKIDSQYILVIMLSNIADETANV